MVQLSEFVTSEQQLTVDREAGVIRSVKMLGRESKNNRVYSEHAMLSAARLYEGAKSYFNHARGKKAAERRFEDFAGNFRNVAYSPDKQGVFGDFHVNRGHPNSAQLFEAAERFHENFGLSHDAEGNIQKKSGSIVRENGKVIVESVDVVHSIDVVTDPATVNSLYESVDDDHEEKKMKRKINEILKHAPDTVDGYMALTESVVDGVIDGDSEIEVSEDSSPVDQIKAAIHATMQRIAEGMDAGGLAGALDQMRGKKKKKKSDDEESDESTERKNESVGGKTDDRLAKLEERFQRTDAENHLLKEGREASEEQIELLVALPREKWKSLVEQFAAKESGTFTRYGRRPNASPPATSAGRNSKTDIKAVRERHERRATENRKALQEAGVA